MKKRLLLILLFILCTTVGFSQGSRFWSSVDTSKDVKISKSAERLSFPTDFKLFQLDLAGFRQAVSSTTEKNATNPSAIIISLPNATGQMERFEIYESSNFTPELQAQFPEIRAYAGVGIDDRYAQVRLSSSPEGIQAMVFRTDKSNEFMEPYSTDGKIYAVYTSSRIKGELPFTCSTEDKNLLNSNVQNLPLVARSSTGQLKTMRLALSCTAEYSNYFGATSNAQVANVITAFNATMSRVNGVFEKDFAVHLNIIAESSNVIYYVPATDPYSPAATGSTGVWNAELQNTLSGSLTGAGTALAANNAVYDIGHLFGASGGGGNAGCIGCVCVNDTASTTDKNKGSGFTSPGDAVPSGDTFDIDFVAHEMGHQLGGNHTFSHAFENNAVNVEPGSGSTIMGYAGITGGTDVQAHSDDYFSFASIAQIQNNLATKTCPVTTTISRAAPVMNAGLDWTIPKGTAFKLTGSGTASTPINYCWEQSDDRVIIPQPANPLSPTAAETAAAAATSYPSGTKTDGPNFRSFAPVSVPYRYFPAFSTVLTNTLSSSWEATCTVARTLNFTLTGRDNVIGGGQTGLDNTVVTVSGTVGPFAITSPNVENVSWSPGSTQNITWDVNNTTTLVGSSNINILFSSDAGATFTTIVANTPNDGSEIITVPTTAAPYCRIMIQPVGNIYYAVSKSIAVGYTVVTTTTCTPYTRVFNPAVVPSATGYSGYALTVPDNFTISDFNVSVDITAARLSDLSLGIAIPGSTTVTSTFFLGGGCNLVGTNLVSTFDDSGVAFVCTAAATGQSYLPTSSFSTYNGMNSGGAWIFAARRASATRNVAINSVTYTMCSTNTVVTLATDNFEINDFALYPNPNNGNFTIQFTPTSGADVKVGVYDMRGREVFNKSYQNSSLFNQTLQLNNLQAGIYLVNVQDGQRKIVKKIVIE